MAIIFFLLLIFNFAISWVNAWSVGRGWAETKAVGGFPRFMSWMGAVMSASGFTWVYTIVLMMAAHAFGYLPEKYMQAGVDLGYLIVIFPILGSGLAITIQSWAHFWKKRTVTNGAIAGYNTFADVYNTYEAIEAVPNALEHVGDLFDGDSDDVKGKLAMLVVGLAVLALAGGILTTTFIVRSTVKNVALEERLAALA